MNTYLVWEQGDTENDALKIEAASEHEAGCLWAIETQLEYKERRNVVVKLNGVEINIVVYGEKPNRYSLFDECAE